MFNTVYVYQTSCVDNHRYSDLVSGFPYPLASLDNFFADNLQSSTVTIVTSLVKDGWRRKLSLRIKIMLLWKSRSSKIQIAITMIACAGSVALSMCSIIQTVESKVERLTHYSGTSV